MKIYDVEQNTQEWLDVRDSEEIDGTASETAAMLDISPYQSRNELMAQKKFGVKREFTTYQQQVMDNGHVLEDMAMSMAEGIVGEELFKMTASEDFDGLCLLASYDGITLMGGVVYEHKTMNEELKRHLDVGLVPDQYKPQLEVQLMVSGASKALFMASDGTEENMLWVWYYPDNDLRKKILAGWSQFFDDMVKFELPKEEVKVPAVKIEGDLLPVLNIDIVSGITASNLEPFTEAAMNYVDNINTTLVSDNDFGEAQNSVKICKAIESELSNAEKMIKEKSLSVGEALDTLAKVKALVAKKRNYLAGELKSRKSEIKDDLVGKGVEDIMKHMQEINNRLFKKTPIKILTVEFENLDKHLMDTTKKKSSLKSITNGIDAKVAEVKMAINDTGEAYQEMNEILRQNTPYRHLFADAQQMAESMSVEKFTGEVAERICKFEEERALEQKRMQEIAEAEAREKLRKEQEELERKKAEEEKEAVVERQALENAKLDAEKKLADMRKAEAERKETEAKKQAEEPPKKEPVEGHDFDWPSSDNEKQDLLKWFASWGTNDRKARLMVQDIEAGKAPHLIVTYPLGED